MASDGNQITTIITIMTKSEAATNIIRDLNKHGLLHPTLTLDGRIVLTKILRSHLELYAPTPAFFKLTVPPRIKGSFPNLK